MFYLLLILIGLTFIFFSKKEGKFSKDTSHADVKLLKTNPDLYDSIKLLSRFLATKEMYFNSPKWWEKRTLVHKKYNYQCALCSSNQELEVHHLSGYDKIPNEPTHCLVTLCRSCHQKQHDIHGYPSTYLEYMKWDVKLVQ